VVLISAYGATLDTWGHVVHISTIIDVVGFALGGCVVLLLLVPLYAWLRGGGRGRWLLMTATLIVSACGAPGRRKGQRCLRKSLPSVHRPTVSLLHCARVPTQRSRPRKFATLPLAPGPEIRE